MSVTRDIQGEERLLTELGAYAGQWVAIRDHRVIESAPTLHELLTAITGKEYDAILSLEEEAPAGSETGDGIRLQSRPS